MFIVASYDIPDDKRRNRVRKTLQDFGMRVQYSVFECNLTEKHLKRLKTKLTQVIDSEEDNVRYYLLCNSCMRKVELYGKKRPVNEPLYYIV